MKNFKKINSDLKHEKWVEKYFINYKDISSFDSKIIEEFKESLAYFFDTESCDRYENSDTDEQKVYIWQFGCSLSNYVIYGESLEEFLLFIRDFSETIFYKQTVTKTGKRKKDTVKIKGLEVPREFNLNFVIYVHNLAWDIEFFKYVLWDLDYKYNLDYKKIKDGRSRKLPVKTFSIVENNNIVYSSNIKLNEFKVNDFPCFVELKLYDSYKITNNSLDDIANNYIEIPNCFHKLKENYDYEKFRPNGYIHSTIEKRYCYNDIFIMQQWYKQYYCGLLMSNKKTLSGITFEKCLNVKYKGRNLTENIEKFKENYPNIIGTTSMKIIDKNYKGGFTHTNYNYNSKRCSDYVSLNGISIDINSSYPFQMVYGKLPFGQPVHYLGKYEKVNSSYDLYIQTIRFDGFEPKDKNNKLGIIKALKCVRKILNISPNEYMWTNIINNIVLGKEKEGRIFELSLTNVELEFFKKHYNFYCFKDNYEDETRENLVLKIEYVEGLKFKSRIGDFKEYINWCIQGKKDNKENNKSLYNMYKVLMNAIYGKFASTDKREDRKLIKNNNGTFGFKNVELKYKSDVKYYKPFASFITSLARVKLQKTILEVIGFENFYYCDTDSIYCKLNKETLEKRFAKISDDEIKKDMQYLNGDDLGAWDIEHIFVNSKWLGQKKYLIFDKEYFDKKENKLYKIENYTENDEYYKKFITCKCAGLPKVARDEIIRKEDFYLGKIFGNKKAKVKTIGGYKLKNVTFEIKDFSLSL